jgi:hypothetical protein
MKNKFLLQVGFLIAILFSQNNIARAQWVTIPDYNFVLFLQEEHSTCMDGDQMDTTCTGIVNATILEIGSGYIENLEGIQYFSNLIALDCSENYLTTLPELPNFLENLICDYNYITSLPELPNSI